MFPKTGSYSSVVNDTANIHLSGLFASHITPRDFLIIVNHYPSLTNNFSRLR